MPRFKSIIFYQNSPKIKLFLKKKMQNFQALGALPPDPRASGGWRLRPQTPIASGGGPPIPKHIPPMQISGYAPGNFVLFIIICVFVAFVLSNFFLIVQLQTL